MQDLTSSPRTFAYPWLSHLRLWPGGLVLLFFPLWLVWLGIERGSLEIVFAGTVVCIAAAGPLSAIIRTILSPAWVTVTDGQIVVRNYLFRQRTYGWNEIVEVREFEGPTTFSNTNVRKGVWLVAVSGKVIALDENLPDYWELYEIIRAHTTRARWLTRDTRRWWQRLLNIAR